MGFGAEAALAGVGRLSAIASAILGVGAGAAIVAALPEIVAGAVIVASAVEVGTALGEYQRAQQARQARFGDGGSAGVPAPGQGAASAGNPAAASSAAMPVPPENCRPNGDRADGDSPTNAGSDSGNETTTIGRHMSEDEFNKMTSSGRVQESDNLGVTSVTVRPNPDLYRAAPKGDIFVQFAVPTSSLSGRGTGQAKFMGRIAYLVQVRHYRNASGDKYCRA